MSDACVSLLFPGLLDLSVAGLWERLPRLEGSTDRVFTGADDTYAYAHHASLAVQRGRLYAFWSNGRRGEDLPGQVQCWAMRDNRGSWSAPDVLVRAPRNAALHAETDAVTHGGTARGCGHLTALYCEYRGWTEENAAEGTKWALPLVTGVQTYDAGRNIWTHRGIILEDFLPNEGPRRTALGRWLMTGEDHGGRTRIAYSDAPNPADSMWRVVGVAKGEGSHYKNEPTWYQRQDGTIVLLLRDDGGSRRLWMAESRNNGLSWSLPRPTNIPDATAKCCAGQLSNGVYYLIWNPNPSGERIPLTIALSEDGCLFNRVAILCGDPTAPRLEGRHKGAGYQYPNAVEQGGQLHVIYSLNKEDIEVLSVSLDKLMGLASLVAWPTTLR